MLVMGLTQLEIVAIWAVFGVAWLGLGYAVFLRAQIMREDKGTEKMQEVWNAIKDGANAYLQKQFRSILPLIAVLTVVLFLSVYIVPPSPEAQLRFPDMNDAQLKVVDRYCAWIGLYHGRRLFTRSRSDRHAYGNRRQCACRFSIHEVVW